MTSRDDERWAEVMDRLTRIKTLADRAGTLSEAEAATAALSRLLLKYNLSLADLDDVPGETRASVGSEAFEVENSASWRHYLLHALAQAHFCRAIRYPGTSRAMLVGHPHNIAAVKDFYQWLSVSIERLAGTTWDEERDRDAARLLLEPNSPYRRFAAARDALPTGNRRAWLTAFRTGAVDGLWRRMIDEREAIRQETSPERWALAPILDAEVQTFMNDNFANVGSYQMPAADAAGYNAGQAAGYALDISARGLES
ncbi:MAG: DUF7168 domain-containing protein [Thermomicrobiales bacterium]